MLKLVCCVLLLSVLSSGLAEKVEYCDEFELTPVLEQLVELGLVPKGLVPVDAKTTLLIPTDEALVAFVEEYFDGDFEEVLDQGTRYPDLMAEILSFHNLDTGRMNSRRLRKKESVPTILEETSCGGETDLKINKKKGGLFEVEGPVNSASAVKGMVNIKGCGSIMHKIDAVLLPCSLEGEMKEEEKMEEEEDEEDEESDGGILSGSGGSVFGGSGGSIFGGSG